MLGISPSHLLQGYAADHGLVLIDQSKPNAKIPRFYMNRRQVLEYRFELIEKAKERMFSAVRKVFGSVATRPPYETWHSPIVCETRDLITDAPDERLIRPKEAADLLGVSTTSILRRRAPSGVEDLTVINIAKKFSGMPHFVLVFSEVIALRDELIDAGKQASARAAVVSAAWKSDSDKRRDAHRRRRAARHLRALQKEEARIPQVTGTMHFDRAKAEEFIETATGERLQAVREFLKVIQTKSADEGHE